MGHNVKGVVVPAEAAARVASDTELAVVIPLQAAHLSFVPMTEELFDFLCSRFPSSGKEPFPDFESLSNSVAEWASRLSRAREVAYVETEYFGGVGNQGAAVWREGKIILGPFRAEYGPINEALRLLGVRRTEAEDEFDVAGLGRYRTNEHWLDAKRGR